MRSIRAAIFCLLSASLLAACTASPAPLARPRPLPPSTIDPPPAAAVSIPILELRGTPEQIGHAHGAKLASTIQLLYQHVLLDSMSPSEHFAADMEASAFQPYILPQHLAEIEALADRVGLSPADALLSQCFLDLSPVTACSTIALPASASPDGVARMGRNLDFPTMGVLDHTTVLFIVHPQGRYAFAAVGWPGMVGVLSGMNERGLCLCNMEVTRPARPPSAMPYCLLYRMLLERCATVDEAIALLQATPRQTANNLMLMDAQGHRAVAEIRPDRVTIRRGIPGSALISTNHQRGQDAATPGFCWRYDLLHKAAAAHFGQIGNVQLRRMLGQVVQGPDGSMTLQSMIFEPASRTLFLATGADAPGRPYQRINLQSYFEPSSAAAAANKPVEN